MKRKHGRYTPKQPRQINDGTIRRCPACLSHSVSHIHQRNECIITCLTCKYEQVTR